MGVFSPPFIRGDMCIMEDKMKNLINFFKKKPPFINKKLDKIPKHVAIIMDGNGRWAKEKGLPRVAGHKVGMDKVKEIVNISADLGIKHLTLYAFSLENWKRPKEEVDFLMKLPEEFLLKEINNIKNKNIKINMLGFKEGLPPHTLKAIEIAIAETANNTGLNLNFAINYSGRQELVYAFNSLLQDYKNGKLDGLEIDENIVNNYILSREIPDPDLLIRTSGEIRISNFMLWQIAYTEFYFHPVYWPDFSVDNYFEALSEYQKRSRRFGNIEEERNQ